MLWSFDSELEEEVIVKGAKDWSIVKREPGAFPVESRDDEAAVEIRESSEWIQRASEIKDEWVGVETENGDSPIGCKIKGRMPDTRVHKQDSVKDKQFVEWGNKFV